MLSIANLSGGKEMGSRINTHLGRQIKLARLEQNKSRERFASEVGLSMSQLEKFESGEVHIGSANLLNFAKALDVPVYSFFSGLEGKEKNS